MPKTPTLGSRLTRARKDSRLTQLAVAERLGVKAPRVAEWELDVHVPGAETLRKLAQIYDTTVDALLSEGPSPAAGRPFAGGRVSEPSLAYEITRPKRRKRSMTPEEADGVLYALGRMSTAITELMDEARAARAEAK